MTPRQPDASEHRRQGDGGGCPVPRRSFLRGALGGAAAAAAANLVPAGVGHAQSTGYQDNYNKVATEDSTHSIAFYGRHQAGIATPPQTQAAFLSFDVTAGDRRELTDLFRTLTERAAFLTKGGAPPPARPGEPPEHRHLLGATVLPDDLTVTVALGASLFDHRYGLAPHKPAQLETMRAFAHDDLDPKITHGDLLIQLCANHRDTVGNAMLIIRMPLDKWDEVPVAHQERLFGRRKISGAPLYATDPNASDALDPISTNDPQGRLTPLDCHIRLANPQTPQTAATSTILRRSFQYDQSPDHGGNPNM